MALNGRKGRKVYMRGGREGRSIIIAYDGRKGGKVHNNCI